MLFIGGLSVDSPEANGFNKENQVGFLGEEIYRSPQIVYWAAQCISDSQVSFELGRAFQEG
jgi:hypothetical protein